MLKLSRVAPHEWRFVYPDIYDGLMDQFHAGCELYEEGNLDEAVRVFRAVLAQMPDHLDALHHLALVLSEQNLLDKARDLWSQAGRIGHKAFPQDFQPGKDSLEWGWLENRPFLRCLRGLALDTYNLGKVEEALELFQELLSLNPNDNQGIRAMAVEALFKLGRFEDALDITEHYPGDMMSETIYGRALALFKLGQQQKASVALQQAMEYLPLVAKELLKTRHRLSKTANPDMVAIGSANEAYYYWEDWGQFWEEDPEALKWLRGMMMQTKKGSQDKDR
ncbi:MAG: tetratricopeptide repeat protein [Dehalococcoidia bacterium]|nr:tetratricopeptide repeat protein [Dehalococcoidia bacterium]